MFQYVFNSNSDRRSEPSSLKLHWGRSVARRLPIVLMCSASLTALVHAQEIDSTITDPVKTSTINDGAPGDVVITDDGEIESTDIDDFVAVTLDSNNSVTNEGDITLEDGDGTVGILMTPGFSGDVVNIGTITVWESYEREDEDDDDDLDGPYAQGSNRYGILLQSGGSFTGDIITETGSSIYVLGNDSAAIALWSSLTGDITLDGSLYVEGDNAVGLDVAEDLTGNILISGSTQVKGENSTAINIGGNVYGSFVIESAVLSTGFDSLSDDNYVAPSDVDDDTLALEDRIDAEVLLDNKAAVLISGSISNGILINGNVDTYTSEEDEDDETKDTVDDFDDNRGTATIASYGSGPAILISAEEGDQTGDLLIGGVIEQIRDTTDDDDDEDVTELLATFSYAEGLINRGVVSGIGLNVGYDATAFRIEGELTGDAKTIIEGGILNSGSMSARAYEANATAFWFGRNAVTDSLVNSGAITATSYTTDKHSAIGILLDEGADLDEIENSGSITVQTVGRSGHAVGVRDLGSTVTSFTNLGTIYAYHTGDGESVDEVGDLIAIDFSAHNAATGVTFVQDFAVPTDDTNEDDEIDTDDVTSPYIIGDILFGAGNDNMSVLAGYISGDIDFGTGDATLSVNDAEVYGDTTFADGTHTVNFTSALYSGDLSFDSSTASISMIDGSEFYGQFITNDALLSVTAANSYLYLTAGNVSTLTDFSITGASDLVFEIDPDDTDNPILTVTGSATIGGNVTITPVLTALPDELTTQTLISAGTLNFDGDYSDLELSGVPWLYTTELQLSDTDGLDTLDLVFVQKTPDELGLNTNETAAFSSLIELFAKDDDLGAAISALTTEHDFNEFYNLLIPQRTDASTRYLEAQSNAAFGALDDALETASLTKVGGVRYWAQEYFVGMDQDASIESPGYNGGGFGMTLGVDRSVGTLNAVGIMMGFSSGEFEEKTGGNNPVSTTTLNFGAYVQDDIGPIDLRLAGILSKAKFDAHRDIEFSDSYFYNLDAEWGGWSASLSANASSTLNIGPLYVRPAVAVDWFSLSQDDYKETGGEDLLEAAISDVTTDSLTASGLVSIGKDWKIGDGFLRTELRAGYRNVLSSTAYETEVSYLGTDQSFTLSAMEEKEDATVLGVSLLSVGDITTFNFGYDYEKSDSGETHFAGATVRVKF